VTTSELERRLTALLKQHAEDAMNSTRTEQQLDILAAGVEQERRQRRRNWAAGGLAAAAATVGLVLWASNLGAETDTAVPAQQPAVEVATSFLAAYASFDRDEAESYLADDAFLDDVCADNAEPPPFASGHDSRKEPVLTHIRCTF
jgi:hypothetical protein